MPNRYQRARRFFRQAPRQIGMLQLRHRLFALACILCLIAVIASAQSLPTPSRTVFKCTTDGRVTYSDSPCLGAEKLDVEPTRGMNKATGKKLLGPDVRHERYREDMANALKPITGLDAKQLDTAGRRMKLSSDAQRECKMLDAAIPTLERGEKKASDTELPAVQRQLFQTRSRYRSLGC